MPDSPTPEAKSDFVCDCEESVRSACAGEPFYEEHEGKQYCVLHYPSLDKAKGFAETLKRKIANESFNFRGTWFPGEVNFSGHHFKPAVDFAGAHFEQNADFSNASFERDVNFSHCSFNAYANFDSAEFVQLEEPSSNAFKKFTVDFSSVVFAHGVNFQSAHFYQDRIIFRSAIFRSYALFGLTRFMMAYVDSSVDFSSAVFEELVNFSDAELDVSTNFRSTRFRHGVSFRGAKIYSAPEEGLVNFRDAVFEGMADFRLARIGTVRFTSAVFEGPAVFEASTFTSNAEFLAVTFRQEANFSQARFDSAALFSPYYRISGTLKTNFLKDANFADATFRKNADFKQIVFNENASFKNAEFVGDVDFSNATFGGDGNFASCTMASYVRFSGDDAKVFSETSVLSLEHAWIKKPEHMSFHAISLKPSWFIRVDVRRFEFIDVDWQLALIEQEIEALKVRGNQQPHRMLSIAQRGLAVNAEENHRYEEASKFRYVAMDTRRLETWRGLAPWRLSWWYWLASGYGESALRAFLILLAIWFVASLLYTGFGFARWEPRLASESDAVTVTRDDIGAPLKFKRALTYSLAVMALQKPEPKPATTAAQTVVLLETILGPVQAALLALAIRRKFMR